MIHLYGASPQADIPSFAVALEAQLAALGLDPGLVATKVCGATDAHSPGLNLLFTDPPPPLMQVGDEKRWLPVIQDAPSAALLPDWMKGINAFRKESYGTAWMAALVDEVLAQVWSFRKERRVFLSYRREDADGVADQLHDALLRAGFEVFVDRIALRPGAEVQREIDLALYDMDLVVCLLSPRLHVSEWVKHELETARAAGVGVLLAVWPRAEEAIKGEADASADADQQLDQAQWRSHGGLEDYKDMTGAQVVSVANVELKKLVHGQARREDMLPADELDRLMEAIFRERTRSIAGRLKDLVGRAMARYGGGAPLLPGGRSGDLRAGADLIRVLPFRPRPRTLHDLHLSGTGARRICLYMENDPLHADVQAMRWLALGSPVHLEML